VLSETVAEPVVEQRRPGPRDIPYGIPENEWQIVLARVANHESYRTIAKDYGVSRETIRRLVQASKQAS
jgi:DNA invertase Pin-like site-specific DNA recombinase